MEHELNKPWVSESNEERPHDATDYTGDIWTQRVTDGTFSLILPALTSAPVDEALGHS